MLKACKDGLLKFLSTLLGFLGCQYQRPLRLRLCPKPVVGNEGDNADSTQGVTPGGPVADRKGRNSEDGKEAFESEVQRFLQFCHANVGALYCWPTKENKFSGKGLPGAKFKGVYDCSGYVTAGVYFATKGAIDLRASHSAQKLWDACAPCGGNGPCLAFYGLSNHAITHVVVVLPDGRCVGQTKGRRDCTNPAIALDIGARVVYHSGANYRKDLRGFRALPLKGDTHG